MDMDDAPQGGMNNGHMPHVSTSRTHNVVGYGNLGADGSFQQRLHLHPQQQEGQGVHEGKHPTALQAVVHSCTCSSSFSEVSNGLRQQFQLLAAMKHWR